MQASKTAARECWHWNKIRKATYSCREPL